MMLTVPEYMIVGQNYEVNISCAYPVSCAAGIFKLGFRQAGPQGINNSMWSNNIVSSTIFTPPHRLDQHTITFIAMPTDTSIPYYRDVKAITGFPTNEILSVSSVPPKLFIGDPHAITLTSPKDTNFAEVFLCRSTTITQT
jgi:hypothetical protein